jgi:hypothetical protein
MSEAISRRIQAALGAPDLVERLAALPGSDLQSLLLAVMQARGARATPASLLDDATRRAAFAPSPVDARLYADFDRAAFAAASHFEAVELSPLAPFAVDAVFGGISPNNVLPTTRPWAQVIADPTSMMALVAAQRRRAARDAVVRLATTARMVRLQPLPNPKFTPHFKQMAMITAGRDAGSHRFELAELRDHLRTYLRLFRDLERDGYTFAPIEIHIADPDVNRAKHRGGPEPRAGHRRLDAVAAEVFPALAAEFPGVTLTLDEERTQGIDYYETLMLQIYATDATGQRWAIGDGGFTPWTQRLLNDRKERLMTSGLGLELMCKLFRRG